MERRRRHRAQRGQRARAGKWQGGRVMAIRELPVVDVDKDQAPRGGNGRYGAAHVQPRDAYRDVPILKQPTWKHEIAAYFYLGGVSAGAYVLASLAETVGGERYRTLA